MQVRTPCRRHFIRSGPRASVPCPMAPEPQGSLLRPPRRGRLRHRVGAAPPRASRPATSSRSTRRAAASTPWSRRSSSRPPAGASSSRSARSTGGVSYRRATCARCRRVAPRQVQDGQQRLELDLGLGQLRRRVGVAHDADARVAARHAGRVSSAQRSATQNSPSSVASVHPTGPAYQPRSRPSSAGMSGRGAVQRLAADRRRRVQQAGQLDAPSAAWRAARGSACRGAGCWPPARRRARAPPPPTRACGRSARAMRRDDDGLLLAVLVRAQQLLAQVRVDGRVGLAPGRAGQRERRGPHRPRGGPAARARRPRNALSPRAGAEARSRTGTPRAARRARAAASWGAAAWTCTSRASTTFSRSPARMRSTARATAAS